MTDGRFHADVRLHSDDDQGFNRHVLQKCVEAGVMEAVITVLHHYCFAKYGRYAERLRAPTPFGATYCGDATLTFFCEHRSWDQIIVILSGEPNDWHRVEPSFFDEPFYARHDLFDIRDIAA